VKRARLWLLLLLIPVVVAVAALVLPRDDKALLTYPSFWKPSGSIQRAIVDYHYLFSDGLDAIYWVATASGDGSGKLVSKPIEAPGWITLMVSGDLMRPGNDVYFQLVGDTRRIRLALRTEPLYWRRITMALPGDWVGKPMEVVIEAGPRDESNWFGISNPRALGAGLVLLSHLRALAVLPVCLISLLIFLVPGLPLAAHLTARGCLRPSRIFVVTVVFSCLAGYLTFWAYFLNPVVGRLFGAVVLVGGAVLMFLSVRRDRPTRALILSGDVLVPLGLTAAVALLYASIWQSVNLWIPFNQTPRLRFLEFVLALDNELPYYFAERLYNHVDPRELFMGWHSSDRPPLQAGILLLQLPIGYLVRQPEAWSLIFGSALQCVWVPALWEFFNAAGLPRRKAGVALLFVVLTGFSLVNSVFTWPKMLAAALTITAISLALFEPTATESAHRRVTACLWGLAAALGFLAHSGVAFTLLPFGLFLLIPRYFPGLVNLAVAAAVFLAAAIPWSLYQKLYDPPGTELLRQHLAGSSKTWQDSHTMVQNLVDAYKDAGLHKVLDNKWKNVEVLARVSDRVGDEQYPWPPHGTPDPWPVNATALRRSEFLCIFWSAELLNLGWLVAAPLAWRRPALLNPTLGVTTLALVLASAVTWVLLLFGPGATVVHQGSYATQLLLFAGLAAWLTVLPGWWPYAVLVAQGALFSFAWLITSPGNQLGLQNPFTIATALVSFALLCRFALAASAPHAIAGKADASSEPALSEGKLLPAP
jgi:hypothetical protein